MGQQASTAAQDKFPYQPIREIQSSPRISNAFRWSLWDGQDVKDNSKKVSIFCLEPSDSPLAQAMFKRFKTLRHPNILSFMHGITVEEERRTYIVTDRIEPLANKLKDVLALPEAIPWGIHQITKAVHWLNKECNLVHGNINLNTVYVTRQGDWRLGGLDLISPIDEVKNGSAHVFTYSTLATNLQWSPEMQAPLEKALPALGESPNNAIDSWLVGCLIWALYNNSSLASGAPFDRNRLKDMAQIPATLKDDYVKLLTGSPRNRLALDRLLDSPYFDTTFVQTCSFLENLNLKDTFEKEKFFKSLPKILPQFPDAMAKYKILPVLTTGLDFGSADHNALPVVLTIAAKLTSEEYKAQIVPSVMKWFAAPDRTLRLCLLSNVDTIVPHLDSNQVSTIWTPLSQGFTDAVPQLRELTVKSMLQFAPKLNDKIVNGDLLKYLASLQVDPVPGIRCNTTVCLGKLASLLTPAVRQKVLLQAFSRALKDPFPPSRRAALAALSHCHEAGYFTAPDIATRIMPAVAPMALDSELVVRSAALEALATFLKYLEANSAKLPATAPVDPSQAQSQGAQTGNAAAPGAEAGGMLDWALGKVLGSEPKPTPQQGPTGPNPASPHPQQFATSPATPSAKATSTTQAAKPAPSPLSRPTAVSSPTSKPSTGGDVPWEEDDDSTSTQPVARPAHLPVHRQQPAPATASSKPASTTSSGLKSTSSSSSLDGWGDTPSWASPTTKSTTQTDSNGWGDDYDDAPSSFSRNSSSSTLTNTSGKGMALKPASSSSSLTAWTESEDAGEGWGEDFATTPVSVTRTPKNSSSSRFG